MKNGLSWSMLFRWLFTCLFSCLSLHVIAQEPNYPKDYFRNPLDIPILLAGNFGECRPNHFHSGIDIKTNAKENLPVCAAAEGYVSRIKMEKGGFGHALYVTHPNGYTTLYAHLNDFAPGLQRYTEKMQYEKESWAVDIELKPKQFPVKKGEQIAWSGNTGSSTAPHLHFEIRDTKTEHPLNPQLFGFDIKDTRAPVPVRLSFYDLSRSIYGQDPHFVDIEKEGNEYAVRDTVFLKCNRIGIGINVNDYMDGSTNTLNFYTATWYKDDTLQGSIRLDDIGYDVTRYIHAYIDYPLKKERNEWYQLLFKLPGNMLAHIYPGLNKNSGAITVNEERPQRIRIELKDVYGNTSVINIVARLKNYGMLHYTLKDCYDNFKVNAINTEAQTNFKFQLGEKALYDDICYPGSRSSMQPYLEGRHTQDMLSYRFSVGDLTIPVHEYFILYIKPNEFVPFKQRDKVVMKYSDGKDEDGRVAVADEDGWYKASVRNFGTYWLVADTIAPVIKPLQKQGTNLSKATTLSFSVKEDLTSVKKFRAELDGKWLCFEPKGTSFTYKFDDRCKKGKHKLVLTAADENGNERTLVYNFTR